MRASRVLLIEDDPLLADALAEVIRATGVRVDVANTLREARAAAGPAYDVLITDVELPDGDALEEMVRPSALPLIVITGQTRPGVEERARRAGAFRFLRKPVSIDSLRGAVREALERGVG